MKKLFLCISMYILCIQPTIHAQTLSIVGTSVTLSTRSDSLPSLFVSGSTFIASTAHLTNNNALLQTTGDITNDGTYVSTGTELFSGISNQVITGNFSHDSYLGLLVKRNTGNIILASNTDCNALEFTTDGYLHIAAGDTLYVKSVASTAITGYSTVRSILSDSGSYVCRTVADTTAPYAFPLMNSHFGYQNMIVNLHTLGTTGIGSITATLINPIGSLHYESYYPTGFSRSISGDCFSGIDSQWVVFSGIAPSGWNLSGPSDYVYDVNAVHDHYGSDVQRIIYSPAHSHAWCEHITDVVGDSCTAMCRYSDWTGASISIPGGPYRGFGDLAVTAGDGARALPVSLINLNVIPHNQNHLDLTWTTEMEIINDRFDIMRSTDGFIFEKVGMIAGHGTTAMSHDYIFHDESVQNNSVYYYQLYQFDTDGLLHKSTIVSGYLASAETTPVFLESNGSPHVVIHVNALNLPVTYKIMDALGQIMSKTTYVTNEYTIPIHLPDQLGTYALYIQIGQNSYVFKALVINL